MLNRPADSDRSSTTIFPLMPLRVVKVTSETSIIGVKLEDPHGYFLVKINVFFATFFF